MRIFDISFSENSATLRREWIARVCASACMAFVSMAPAAFAQANTGSREPAGREPAGGRSSYLGFERGGEVVTRRRDPEPAPPTTRDRPSIGGRDYGAGSTRSGGTGGSTASVQGSDPYPLLTQYNNIYKEKLAVEWQAHRNYKNALAEQAAMKAKHADANGDALPGWGYDARRAVLSRAHDAAWEAWRQLEVATRDRKQAHDRAAHEFKNAVAQFARAEQARAAQRAAAEEQHRRDYQRQLRSDRRGDSGGR